jgi:hypothetical protein
VTHNTEEERAAVARAYARPKNLVLKGPEDGWYALVDAETLDPVLGLEEDGFRVSLEQVEAHLGI